ARVPPGCPDATRPGAAPPCEASAPPRQSAPARPARPTFRKAPRSRSQPSVDPQRIKSRRWILRDGNPPDPQNLPQIKRFSASQSKTYGTICAATFSATASGTPTRRSSTPVAMPGTPSWKNPTSSPQSEPENGHRSRFKAVGIRGAAKVPYPWVPSDEVGFILEEPVS